MAYHHGTLRDTLLDMAEEIVAETGIEGLSMRACARRAGVSVTAPLHHFPNQKALVTALAARGFEKLLATIERVKTRDGLDDGTQLAILAYVEFGMKYPGYGTFMFRDALLDPSDEVLMDLRTRTLTRLVQMVTSDPQVDAAPGSQEAHKLSLKVWIMSHGLSALLTQTRAAERFGGPSPGLGTVDEIINLVASPEFLRFAGSDS